MMTAAEQWVTEQEALIEGVSIGPWEAPETILGIPVTTVYGPGHRPHILYHSGNHADAAFVAASRTSLPQAVNAIKAVLEKHHRVGVYDECDCTDEQGTTGHEDIYEAGNTCNRLYDICDECCREDVYQTEDCANHHLHSLDGDYCATVTAITSALGIEVQS